MKKYLVLLGIVLLGLGFISISSVLQAEDLDAIECTSCPEYEARALSDDPATPNLDESLAAPLGQTDYYLIDTGWSMYSATYDCTPDYKGWGNDRWLLTLTKPQDLTIRVIDCCCPGDFYEIYVNDELIGTTPEVEKWGCTTYDWEEPRSDGSFTVSLNPGTYVIKIRDAGFDGHTPSEIEYEGMCPAGYTVIGTLSPYTGRIFPDKAVELAKEVEVIGAPYLWGGKGYDYKDLKFVGPSTIQKGYWYKGAPQPRKGKGLDCSGLSMWTYDRAYYGDEKVNWRKCIDYPNFKNPECPLGYEDADKQYKYNTIRITQEELQPGDLIFFKTNPYDPRDPDHVVMYIGEGEVIHAEGVEFKKIVRETLNEVLLRYKTLRGFGRVVYPKIEIGIIGNSPIDLIVIDPDGFVSSKQNPEGPLEYQLRDIDDDGELEVILIGGDLKIGTYQIQVVPKPDALPTDTYSLEITANGETIVLAEDVPISDIPDQPYQIQSSETEIKAAPVADANGPYEGNEGSPITFDASQSYDPDGEIVLYEWDWDNDGAYDESTTSPTITHTWHAEFSGTVTLRVTDNDGLTSIDTASVEVTAPAIAGDLDSDGDVDRNDLDILLTYRNQPASACPECDIDGDGIITVLDARKLVLMCTRPRCATE